MLIMAFMPSIACEIITINSGTTYPNRLQKYTKGLTLYTSTNAKIRLFFELTNFFPRTIIFFANPILCFL